MKSFSAKRSLLFTIIFLIIALLLSARLIPVESKQLVESCGPQYKSRYSIIFGEKSEFDRYQDGTQREAICPKGVTNLKLYIL